MKKKYASIAVAVLLVGYPGIAWLTGYAIESRISVSLDQLRAQSPYLTLVKQELRRGWFTSVQEVTFAISPGPWTQLSPLAGATQLTVLNVIHHGPVCGLTCFGLARVDTHIVLSEAAHAAVAKWYGTADPLTIESRLAFFGGGTTTVSSPALKDVVLDGGGHFAWDGLEMTVAYTNNNDSFDVRASAPHLAYTGASGYHVEVRAATLGSTNRRVLPMLYAGNADVAVDRIDVVGPNGINSTTVNNLAYGVRTRTDAGYMDMAIQSGSGAITSALLKLKEAHLDFTLVHLQMQALESINKKIQELNRRVGSAPAADPGKVLAEIREPLVDLMLQHPEVHIDRIGVSTGSGRVLLSGSVQMRDLVAADFAESANSKDLLARIQADLDFSMDDAALAELPGGGSRAAAQLQPMAQQGYLDHSNGRWQSKIHYAQTRLTLNGKAFPPVQGGAAAAPPGAASVR
jgi:uncharacterized protein YdgA (DUF945 family)